MTGTMLQLIDTSVWIDFLHNPTAGLRHALDADEILGYTEPVLMELLAGCRTSRQETDIERLLARGPILNFDTGSDFVTAAKVHQQARCIGVTPNSYVDCMIITVARNHGAVLRTLDAGQMRIAQLVGVKAVVN